MPALHPFLITLTFLFVTTVAEAQKQVITIGMDNANSTEAMPSLAAPDTPPETETALVLNTTEPAAASDTVQTTGVMQNGLASWYGPGFHGRRTASGSRFDMHAITVAHRTLPLLSYVRITLAETGTQIVAQVTDRGPYIKGRIVDLSKGAAQALGMLGKGLAHVVVEPVVGR